MMATTTLRGLPISTILSRAVQSRIVVVHSSRSRSSLSAQDHSRPFVRSFVSSTTTLQSPPAEAPTRPELLLRQNQLNSITALQENIQKKVLDKKSPPSEAEVILALQACHNFAALQVGAASNVLADASPTSALLSLDEDQIKQAKKKPPHPLTWPINGSAIPTRLPANLFKRASPAAEKIAQHNFEAVTEIAYKIVSHPSVFLTIPILASYVSLQSLISDPSPIPAVFSLYANKPFAHPSSPKTLQPNPRRAKYAIPSNIASAALDVAIKVKDMSLCLDIIDTSYATPAYKRSKLIRKAVPAAMATLLAPAAVFALADTLARYQDEINHSLAVKYAFAGILAYLCFTGSIGMVALMTANDQMVRVTWIVGTPLRQRWLREDERAALDKVAQAWGFEEPNKRGFEEGGEWELLREVVNRKGMYLDNPTLLEGME